MGSRIKSYLWLAAAALAFGFALWFVNTNYWTALAFAVIGAISIIFFAANDAKAGKERGR